MFPLCGHPCTDLICMLQVERRYIFIFPKGIEKKENKLNQSWREYKIEFRMSF